MADRIVNTPTGVIVIHEDGTMEVQKGGRLGGAGPGAAPGFGGGRTQGAGNVTQNTAGAENPFKDASASEIGLDALATGVGMIPGGNALATALRVGGPATIEAGNAYMHGGDPIEAAKKQLMLGGGAEALARALPLIGTPLALAFGGAANPKAGFARTVQAFNQEDARRMGPPLLAGRQRQGNPVTETLFPGSKKALNKVGQTLESAEKMSPAEIGVGDLAIAEPNKAVRLDNSRQRAVEDFNKATIAEQAMKTVLKPRMPGADADQIKAAWEGKHLLAMVPPNAPPGYVQNMIDGWQNYLINQGKLSTRGAGELQRSVSGDAKKIINARKNNVFVPGESDQEAQFNDGLMQLLKDFRHGPGDVGLRNQNPIKKALGVPPKPGETGAIDAADKRSSDLHIIDEANQQMAGGGLIPGASRIATRAGIPGVLAYSLGMDPLTAAALGVGVLNPQVLSGAGFYGARAARLGPTIERAMELNDKVKRREPK